MQTTTTPFTLLLFLCMLGLAQVLSAQSMTQNLRGRIVDLDTKEGLAFVAVKIAGSQTGVYTDEAGYYELTDVPVGRLSIQVAYPGYETKTLPNVIVMSGKETVLDVDLQESYRAIDSVVIAARSHPGEVNNDMALISARNLSVEQTKRFAGSMNDPARLVANFAGVGTTGSGNNDIIVRGNNPRFVQWRLEGIEIPNPNHFSQEGLTGGPVNALNSQMLANSDFFAGAFAPQYGNALSGIFDMEFRKGNHAKREYAFSLGVLGTDLTAEGPFKKGYKGSYLVNYRYSTLDLITQLGVLDFNGIPRYQDASFKLHLPTKHAGHFSVFGLGGSSGITSTFYDNEAVEERIIEQYDQRSRLAVVGLNHRIAFSPKLYLKSTLSYAYNGSQTDSHQPAPGTVPPLDADSLVEFAQAQLDNQTYRLTSILHYKANARHQLQLGVQQSWVQFDFQSSYFDRALLESVQDQARDGQAQLTQLFASWKWRATEQLTLVGGLQSQQHTLNKQLTFEPRLSLRYALTPKQAISAGFGRHSRMATLPNHFAQVLDANNQLTTPNVDLGFLQAHHYVLGYENRLAPNLWLKLEAYYQQLFDIPVDIEPNSYSLLNMTWINTGRALVNEGKGRNLGLELTLEKYFSQQYYFLITGSLFQSEYLAGDQVWRNTRFNGNYLANVLVGKEFTLGEKRGKHNTLGINLRMTLIGGLRQEPIDVPQSIEQGFPIIDETRIFEDRYPDVFSLNVAVNYRINQPKVSHEFKLDVQNATNNAATVETYFNSAAGELEEVTQLPLLPLVRYTIYF